MGGPSTSSHQPITPANNSEALRRMISLGKQPKGKGKGGGGRKKDMVSSTYSFIILIFVFIFVLFLKRNTGGTNIKLTDNRDYSLMVD